MTHLSRPSSVVFLVGFVAYTAIRGVYARRSKRVPTAHRPVDTLEKALLLGVIPPSLILPLLYLFTPWLGFADYRLPAPTGCEAFGTTQCGRWWRNVSPGPVARFARWNCGHDGAQPSSHGLAMARFLAVVDR